MHNELKAARPRMPMWQIVGGSIIGLMIIGDLAIQFADIGSTITDPQTMQILRDAVNENGFTCPQIVAASEHDRFYAVACVGTADHRDLATAWHYKVTHPVNGPPRGTPDP